MWTEKCLIGANMPETKKFRDMDLNERLDYIKDNSPISEDGMSAIRGWKEIELKKGENHIGFMPFSIGLVKITVDGKVRPIPIVTEEPSVVAAASHGAKMAASTGGFETAVNKTETTGQIQIIGIPAYRMEEAIEKINASTDSLTEEGNQASPHLVAAGGGIRSIRNKVIDTKCGQQLIIDFDVECMEAMGANAVSKMAEAMAKPLEEITGGKVVGRILSNLHIGRVVTCAAKFDRNAIGLRKEMNGNIVEISPDEMIDRIVALSEWAANDQFRATTHNKGIMNGVIGAANALGQDTRAMEAAAHSYAAFGRPYSPLSYYERSDDGNLYGCLKIPIPVGVVGGVINTNPIVKGLLEMTGCNNSRELASAIAAVGLAQNVSALRMLAGEGITNGHLPLHRLRTEQGQV